MIILVTNLFCFDTFYIILSKLSSINISVNIFSFIFFNYMFKNNSTSLFTKFFKCFIKFISMLIIHYKFSIMSNPFFSSNILRMFHKKIHRNSNVAISITVFITINNIYIFRKFFIKTKFSIFLEIIFI